MPSLESDCALERRKIDSMISSASLLFSSHLSWSWLLAVSFFPARQTGVGIVRIGAYRPQATSQTPHRVQSGFDFLSFRRISHPIFTLPLSNSSSLPSAPTPTFRAASRVGHCSRYFSRLPLVWDTAARCSKMSLLFFATRCFEEITAPCVAWE